MGLLQEKLSKFREPQKYMEMGIYPYFREIDSHQDTEVTMSGKKVLMLGSLKRYKGTDEFIELARIAQPFELVYPAAAKIHIVGEDHHVFQGTGAVGDIVSVVLFVGQDDQHQEHAEHPSHGGMCL